MQAVQPGTGLADLREAPCLPTPADRMNAPQDASAHAAAGAANYEGKTICHAAACGSGSHGSQRSLLVAWHSEAATPPHGAQSPDPAPAPPPSVAASPGTPSPNAVPPLPPRRKNANPSEPGAHPRLLHPSEWAAQQDEGGSSHTPGSSARSSGPPSPRGCSPSSTPPSSFPRSAATGGSFPRSPSSRPQSPAATGCAPEPAHSHHLSAPMPKRRDSYRKRESFPIVLNPLAEDNVWPLPISAENARSLLPPLSPANVAEDAPPPPPPPRRRTESVLAAEIATEIAAEIAAATEIAAEIATEASPEQPPAPPPRGGQHKRLAAAAIAAGNTWQPFSPPPLSAPAPPPRRSRSRKASGDMALYGEAAAQAEPAAAYGASAYTASSCATSSAGQSEDSDDLAFVQTSLQSPPGMRALLSLGRWEDAHALLGAAVGGSGGGAGAAAADAGGRVCDFWGVQQAEDFLLQQGVAQKAALPQRRHSWAKGIPIADGDDVGDAAVDVGVARLGSASCGASPTHRRSAASEQAVFALLAQVSDDGRADAARLSSAAEQAEPLSASWRIVQATPPALRPAALPAAALPPSALPPPSLPVQRPSTPPPRTSPTLRRLPPPGSPPGARPAVAAYAYANAAAQPANSPAFALPRSPLSQISPQSADDDACETATRTSAQLGYADLLVSAHAPRGDLFYARGGVAADPPIALASSKSAATLTAAAPPPADAAASRPASGRTAFRRSASLQRKADGPPPLSQPARTEGDAAKPRRSFFGGLLRRKQQAKDGKEPRKGLTRSSSMPHQKVATCRATEERL